MTKTESDVDVFIEINFEPVEDKPGYVWLNKRNMRIIDVNILKAAIEKRNKDAKDTN